jgi:hypothetical protein
MHKHSLKILFLSTFSRSLISKYYFYLFQCTVSNYAFVKGASNFIFVEINGFKIFFFEKDRDCNCAVNEASSFAKDVKKCFINETAQLLSGFARSGKEFCVGNRPVA